MKLVLNNALQLVCSVCQCLVHFQREQHAASPSGADASENLPSAEMPRGAGHLESRAGGEKGAQSHFPVEGHCCLGLTRALADWDSGTFTC